MPRKDSPFEYGGQWLDRYPGSPHWYRCWYDPRRRRVSKSSLGTGELEQAKAALIHAVVTMPRTPKSSDDVQMIAVEAAYIEHALKDRPRTEIEARRAFRFVTEYMEPRSPRHRAYRVSEFDMIEQRGFMRHLSTERELSPKSISTALSFVGAAVNWASQDQIVVDGGRERQIRILTAPITVQTNVNVISEVVSAEVDDSPRWMPSIADVARFIDAIDAEAMEDARVDESAAEMVFRFVIVALNTWARREAVTDLRLRGVDFRNGLVNLNPPGRKQTKKRRATIRLTDNLRGWLLDWGDDWPVRWYRKDRSDLWDGFRAVAARSGLPKLTPHVLRHFMSSQALAAGVPDEQRSIWLGHRMPNKSVTTEIYEHATPNFLEAARAATDSVIAEIDLMCSRRLVLGSGSRQIAAVSGAAKLEQTE